MGKSIWNRFLESTAQDDFDVFVGDEQNLVSQFDALTLQAHEQPNTEHEISNTLLIQAGSAGRQQLLNTRSNNWNQDNNNTNSTERGFRPDN